MELRFSVIMFRYYSLFLVIIPETTKYIGRIGFRELSEGTFL